MYGDFEWCGADVGVVSLHAGLSAQDFGPALAHLINLCSSPSKQFAEFVMNFGLTLLELLTDIRTQEDYTTCAASLYQTLH